MEAAAVESLSMEAAAEKATAVNVDVAKRPPWRPLSKIPFQLLLIPLPWRLMPRQPHSSRPLSQQAASVGGDLAKLEPLS